MCELVQLIICTVCKCSISNKLYEIGVVKWSFFYFAPQTVKGSRMNQAVN